MQSQMVQFKSHKGILWYTVWTWGGASCVCTYVKICTLHTYMLYVCLIHIVADQSSSQQKPLPSLDPESLKLQFVELEKSWEELSRRECMSGTDQRSLVRCSRDECTIAPHDTLL